MIRTSVPPTADRQALARRLFTVRALLLDGTLAEVARAFDEAGVRSLLLKGPAFARWLYEEPRRRAYMDIDLLIDPDCLAAAEAELAKLGFAPATRVPHPHELAGYYAVWQRDRLLCVEIDLHHSLYFLQAPPKTVWDRMSEGAQTIKVSGARIAVPGPPAAALIVALHAAHHGRGDAKPIEDLRRALDRVDIGVWSAATRLAHDLAATEAFALGLRLTSAGGELAQRLGLPAVASRRLLLQTGSPPATAEGIEWLVSTPGLSAKLRLLAGELVPSPEFMRTWHPLARHGPCGMAVAYLWRPVWLAMKLPSGLRSWLRAARAASGTSPANREPV